MRLGWWEPAAEPSVSVESYVVKMGSADSVVDAFPLKRDHRRHTDYFEAFALPSMTLSVVVPANSDRFITVEGPDYEMQVPLPSGKQPGEVVEINFDAPEYKVTVPPGFKGGERLLYRDPLGFPLEFPIPVGHGPGDTFKVAPPTMLVKVPKYAQRGDVVVFQGCGEWASCWLSARVPPSKVENEVFCVRLPALGTTELANSASLFGQWGY